MDTVPSTERVSDMPEAKGSAAELARLEQERDNADRAYNEALTRIDGAIRAPRELPNPPAAYDELQITPLNERWELLSLKPSEAHQRPAMPSR